MRMSHITHNPQPLPDGNLIVQGCTVQQLFEMMKLAAREVMDERETATATAQAANALPNELPAKEAAKMCGYATAKSLAKFHHAGLTPMRNGKRIFYKKSEVLALKKRIFNL